ncbi:MAG: discoidin domain-containing protein, partial [Acutalibacteraceae bacterium]
MKRLLSVLTVIGLLLTVVPMALADTPAVQKIDLSGATLSATSADAAFPATNAIDGDQGSFWNSSKTGSNPCSHKLTVFLDAVYMVDHFVFKLPGHWGDRNEDAVISVSTNGLTFTPVKETTLSFHSANSNVVTVTLDEPVKASSLQLEITSNTDSGENGRAQLGEWEIYGYADPDSAGMPVIGKMALTVDQFFSSGSGDPLERLIDGKFYNANDQWRPNNMPGWLAVNFKGLCEVSAVVIQLPTSWGDRVQTIEVLGSTDGAEYTTLIEAQDYTFGKDEKSTLVLTMPQGTRVQFLKILVTKNTGDGRPQFAELEVYGAMIPGSAAIEKIPLDSTMVTVSGTSFGNADYAVDGSTDLGFDQQITVTAEGEVAYWVLDGAKVGFGKSRYTFYVSGDNNIAAVLTADAEPIAPAVVLQQATYAQGSETFTLTVIAQTSIPAGSTVSEYGVIFTSKVPTAAFL